jgi:hypothetical protein
MIIQGMSDRGWNCRPGDLGQRIAWVNSWSSRSFTYSCTKTSSKHSHYSHYWMIIGFLKSYIFHSQAGACMHVCTLCMYTPILNMKKSLT